MTSTLQTSRLDSALADLHRAGMPGVIAEVRQDDRVWQGAAGVADRLTGRPATLDLRHRVGSITKTFTAATVLRQVERGLIELDAPIGGYLPHLVPGDRGNMITVGMLINHTSGLAEYLPYAYPSLAGFPVLASTSPDSLERERMRRFDPLELITLGVSAPATGEPGCAPGVYSNTNYLLLGQLLGQVCGMPAEDLITREIIEPAGLQQTGFPSGPQVEGPQWRLYESWFGMFDPPRDFSVCDMSWVGVSASLVSTMSDLNTFFSRLLAGEVVGPSLLQQMQQTNQVVSFEQTMIDYGLGLHRKDIPGHGTFWGHDGSVWGGGAICFTSADRRRQLAVGINQQRWNSLGSDGRPQPHPIDKALSTFLTLAMTEPLP